MLYVVYFGINFKKYLSDANSDQYPLYSNDSNEKLDRYI